MGFFSDLLGGIRWFIHMRRNKWLWFKLFCSVSTDTQSSWCCFFFFLLKWLSRGNLKFNDYTVQTWLGFWLTVLYPALGSPAQEWHGLVEASLEEATKIIRGKDPTSYEEKTETIVFVLAGEGKALGWPNCILPVPEYSLHGRWREKI